MQVPCAKYASQIVYMLHAIKSTDQFTIANSLYTRKSS